MEFSNFDYTLFFGYIFLIIGFGIWLSRKKGGNETSKDYFLASKSLPWWAVGGSLIASNISTEQILGMNGSGFVMGLAIGTYELMAAATLLIVAKFFLPIFIKKGIYTMPQFLEMRYDNRVRIGLGVFWLMIFVFVNITSVLYLGGLAIQSILGVPLIVGIVGLALYSASFSIFGGLKAVVWTDVVQVVVLIIGGFTASYLVVSAVGDGGFLSGMASLYEKAPEKFDMILDESNPSYLELPGISVLIGGMWIANLYYWGTNQYIIQRALAAKNIQEAQRGVAFAAFLKIFMPLIVVIPGIAAFVLGAELEKPDQAFPWVLGNYIGTGMKGLVTAALVAAIGSSISSMVNSASTIFTLDIYKTIFNNGASEKNLVYTGKIASALAIVIGVLIAPALGTLDQVFQYIQEYTGFISPGVLAVFLFGLFWKRTTANAALWVVILSIPLSWALQTFYPLLPFLDRMGFCFLTLSLALVAISLLESKMETESRKKDYFFRILLILSLLMISIPSGFKIVGGNTGVDAWFGALILALSAILIAVLLIEQRGDNDKAVEIDNQIFRTEQSFNISAIAVCGILALIYILLW
jgi:SSS family solute:Na+ symporter